MFKRFLSVFLALSIALLSVISTGFSVCSVTIRDGKGELVKSYYSARNISNQLEKALEYTRRNANASNPLIIRLSRGKYEIKRTLYLSSNTTVDLNGSTLINSNTRRGNIFKSPIDREYPEYSSLSDTVLKNGTLDGAYNLNKSCILRLCHSENIIIKNVTFLNNYYSHHCELAACRNVLFDNCTFKGQVSDLNLSSSEAIQLDILDRVHYYGFTCYDNTMNDSITVSSCFFKDVYRGIGTHNYFPSMYQSNITIVGCTFQNIKDCAVSAVNFSNVSFFDNQYVNCRYSVFFRNNGK